MEKSETKVGRKPGVEDSRIIEAAKTIIEQNKPVSGWSLRNVIGTGTPGRMMKVWEEYLQETGNALPTTTAESEENRILPPELEDSKNLVLGALNSNIEEMFYQANSLAVRAADKRVSTEYNASKKAREEAEQQLAEAEVALSHADTKVEELQTRILELEDLYRQSSADLQSSKTTNKSLEKQLTSITKERDEFKQRSADQAQEITENKVAISTANNKNDQLATDLESMRVGKKLIKQDLAETKHQLAKNEGILEATQADIESKAKQLNDLSIKLDETHSSYEDKLAEQSELIGTLKGQKTSAEEKIEKMELKHLEDQELIDGFKENLVKIQSETETFTAETKEEIKSLTEQLKESQAKVEELEVKNKGGGM